MNLSTAQQESDAWALWEDALDLLAGRGLAEPVMAMLRSCVPTELEGGTLRVETPMRLSLKKVQEHAPVIEECLSQAAFEPIHLEVALGRPQGATTHAPSSMSSAEAREWHAQTSAPTQVARPAPSQWEDPSQEPSPEEQLRERRTQNPLVEDISQVSSKLTFERFVRGEENEFAYTAALQVANGMNSTYNPLFIYGSSGLGKTHLLRAIQNYIAQSDPSRICVYREATTFISDYTDAMRNPERSAAQELRHNYADIDVLIIDDVQRMAGKTGTIGFFFDTFNELIQNGKQIVLAADRTPAQLGMGKDAFDERVTSRLESGFLAPIQLPSYELKLRLVETFCARLREDAEAENVPGLGEEIPPDIQQYMAELSGSNIRSLEGFCQRCLISAGSAEARGQTITREEVQRIAKESWPTSARVVSIEDVQKVVERAYGVSHDDLVSSKRHKNVAEARHVAIWLSRRLCDRTLADIGKHFGGRSHATVMHSISVVDAARREDKIFYDRLTKMEEDIAGTT